MAETIPAGIKFKYIKISGGSSVVDVTMDDSRFYTNKPDGYYRCFIFPKADFAGIGYKDLKDFVGIEESEMWREIERDTFLGYNEESKTFICNIIAYMGLKDSDLKNTGNCKYSGMAGWYEMTITTTASEGIIKLKQTDGSDIYLKIKPNVISTNHNLSKGNICVENIKKKVAGSTVFIKNDALWCKSPEDNSIIIAQNNITKSPIGSYSFIYQNSNRVINHDVGGEQRIYQSFMYGKHVVYFPDATSGAPNVNNLVSPIANTCFFGFIKNNTGKDHVEYTETSNLNDILSSNESLTFATLLKSKYLFASKVKIKGNVIKDVPAEKYYEYAGCKAFNSSSDLYSGSILDYSNPALEGTSCDLVSLDPKDKPFKYIAPERSILIENTKGENNINNMYNVPDGFIILQIVTSKSKNVEHVVRFKGSETPKIKKVGGQGFQFVKISDSTKFGDDIYQFFGVPTEPFPISKDDVINATGFSDISLTEIYKMSPPDGQVITVYKI